MGDSERVETQASRPLVTVGMPTYNGSRFIARSLESLLAQDYPNWRLVVSDNASTDDTGSIARAYADRDPRITYSRSESNVGAAGNFNRALGLAGGTYFMWAADHDLWDPALISTCVRALEANPAAVLAYPESLLIDEDGAVIGPMDDQIDLDQRSALARYKRLIWHLDVCNMVYGVFRRDALLATPGFAEVHGMDHGLLAAIVLMGPVLRVGGKFFLRRQNWPVETPEENRVRALLDLDPANGARRAAVATGRLYKPLRDLHLRIVRHSGLSFAAKVEAGLATLDCFGQRFEVRSITMSVVRTASRVLRMRGRLDRRLGAGD